MLKEIQIKQINKPAYKRMDEDIGWICNSFGLSSGRDTNNIATQLVQKIIIHQHETQPVISSDFLSEELGIATARVNHHLRNLMEAGLLQRERRLIFLRGRSLKATVQEIRKDTERIFDEIELIAEDIDKYAGLNNR